MHNPQPAPNFELHVAIMRRVLSGKSPDLKSAIEAELAERSEPRKIERVLNVFFGSERQLVKAQAEARAKFEAASLALKTERQLAVKLLGKRASLTEAANEASHAAGIARSKLESVRVRIAKANDALARRITRGEHINPHVVIGEATTAAAFEHVGALAAAQSAAADKASAEADAELAAFLEQHAEDLAVVEIGA